MAYVVPNGTRGDVSQDRLQRWHLLPLVYGPHSATMRFFNWVGQPGREPGSSHSSLDLYKKPPVRIFPSLLLVYVARMQCSGV